ncbi:MAG: PEP-CTERM sorting domain-containing protein [Akkermansiaceae bacterium]
MLHNLRQVSSAIFLASASVSSGAITAIDFGTTQATGGGTPNVLFTGNFDGSTGFVDGSVPVSLGPNVLTVPLGGGAQIEFSNVGAWGNPGETAGSGTIGALSQSYIFSGAGNATGDAPFTISGVAATDTVRVEFIGGPARVGIVEFNGSGDVTIPANAAPSAFTQIGADATGSTSYSGSLRGSAGAGEVNFSAARISITPVPEAGSMLLLGIAVIGLAFRRRK